MTKSALNTWNCSSMSEGGGNFLCPICLHPSFGSVTSLWQGLMSGASRRLACPVCQEVLLGLDKLTLHLYSHLPLTSQDSSCNKHSETEDKQTFASKQICDSSFITPQNNMKKISDIPSQSNNIIIEKPYTECMVNKSVRFSENGPESANSDLQMLFKLSEPPLRHKNNPLPTKNNSILQSQTFLDASQDQRNLHFECEVQCEECGAVFANRRMLASHTELLHPRPEVEQLQPPAPQQLGPHEEEFSCHLCSKRFKMRGSLMVHVRFVHGGARLGKALRGRAARAAHTSTAPDKTENLTNAVESRSTKERICSPEPFPSLAELSEQLAASPSFSAPLASPPQVQDMVQQAVIHSSDGPSQAVESSELVYPPSESTLTEVQKQCALQDWISAYVKNGGPSCSELENSPEWRSCTKEPTNELDPPDLEVEGTSPATAGGAAGKKGDKLYECEVCSKRFTTKYFHKKHQRLHTGERPYQCTACSKTFAFQQSFHKHLLYHTSAKPHVCGECGQAFKELSTLHNHHRIHTGERPFVCETCGKAFRQRVSYLVHRRIHTGALPYKCSACNKCFRYKVSQRTHKCPEQPPGSVLRQSDLVQRLLQRVAETPALQNAPPPSSGQQAVQETSRTAEEPTPDKVASFPPLITINEESLHQLLAIFPN